MSGILGDLSLAPRKRRVLVGHNREGKAVHLTLHAPRLQEVDDLKALFPAPVAPPRLDARGKTVTLKDSRGNALRDAEGSPVIERNLEDPDYLKACERTDRAQTVALVMLCAGDQIKPEQNKPPLILDDYLKRGDRVGYYLDVLAALERAGIGTGAFGSLSNAAVELGQPVTREEIEEARVYFELDKASQDGLHQQLKAEKRAAREAAKAAEEDGAETASPPVVGSA